MIIPIGLKTHILADKTMTASTKELIKTDFLRVLYYSYNDAKYLVK